MVGGVLPTIWRKYSSPIILVALVVLLAFGVWWGYSQLLRPPNHHTTPCVIQEAGELSVDKVSVQVFNTGSTPGLAAQVTDQLKAKGFITKSPRNQEPPEAGTVIVGVSEDAPEVKLVQGFFPESTIRADGRGDGTVSVLVSDNYAGFNADAPTSIEVPAGEVCLPSQSAASPTETAAPEQSEAEQTTNEG